MDFPAYVPAAVREKITEYLEGEPDRGIPGFEELKVSGAAHLAETEGDLKEWAQRLASIPDADIPLAYREKIVELRRDKAYQEEHLEQLGSDVDCLRRLAHDERMAGVYALLTREFTDDQQWRGFIYAAWSARMDFGKFREQLKRAAELKAEIGRAADTLAKLIRQFSETGIYGPSEFYSIPELLRQTDNLGGRDFYMWRSMRQHVLGDPRWRDAPEIEPAEDSGEPPNVAIVRVILEPGEKTEIDPKEEARNMLRYAWGTAPDLPALLDAVALAALNFKPSESGMIGAAIESRQRNQKTEYLRAFGSVLTDVHGFALTKPIMQAMAIVANVVINLPDIDATYDDVKKAIAKLGSERLENSGEK
jgi:hypothetical protein